MKLILLYTVLGSLYAMTDTPSPSVTGTSSQSQSASASPSETSNYTVAIIKDSSVSSASNEFPIEAAIFIGVISSPIVAIVGYIGYMTMCKRRIIKKQTHNGQYKKQNLFL